MNKKIKLALGLTFGAIVSTAAITTMAVSCSNEPEKVVHKNGAYSPTKEIGQKFTQDDFNTMKANLEKAADKIREQLVSSGATNIVVKTMIALEGTQLAIGHVIDGTQEGVRNLEDLTTIYNLVPVDGLYQVSTTGTIITSDQKPNEQVESKKISLEELQKELTPI